MKSPLTPQKQALEQIQVVMINTTLPANIGSAARAMHTMGLSKLVVVNPKYPIDDSSISHSAGGIEILKSAKVVSSLDEAVANSSLIFAASSRSRTMPRPVVNPLQSAHVMIDFLSNQPPQSIESIESIENIDSIDSKSSEHNESNAIISILFGREDRGLTNEELGVADYHIQIDANPDYPVLNVASAVQVIGSFIYSCFNTHFNTLPERQINRQIDYHTKNDDKFENSDMVYIEHSIRQQWDAPAINQKQKEQLNSKVIQLMQELELAEKGDLRLLPQRISRLTSRTQLDQKEYQLINAIVEKFFHKLSSK